VPIPTTLGAVIAQCRDLWGMGGPRTILEEDVRIIRNADGHREVEVNVGAEEVWFVNRRGEGVPPDVLGPWKEPQLKALAEAFVKRCWSISVTYAHFLSGEISALLPERRLLGP
jgi:hypothetical protein